MIKTWLIVVFVSILIMIVLLAVNLMLLVNVELSVNFLKQKRKAIIADSCIDDFFKSISTILDDSISSSRGNFSIMRETLEKRIEKLMEKVSKTKGFLEECGLKICFENSIVFLNNTEEYVIQIAVKAYAEDCEGFFSIRRSSNIVRFLRQEICEESNIAELFPNNSS
ncbi:MAG: hypothetical protein QXN75_01210 [Thermoproteota archaeon]|nr:hypothetical protein [Candidatus Brockarchaeota archaeon]